MLGSTEQTCGFIAKNRQEAVDAVAKFISFERELPNPQPFWEELLDRLRASQGDLTYTFDRQTLEERALVSTCGSVRICDCGANHYAVQFGAAFTCPELNKQIGLPHIARRRINFELVCIPDSHGTRAFSESAAVEALCHTITATRCSINKSNHSELLVEHTEHQYCVGIDLFVFVGPFTPATNIRTKAGLLVIPADELQTHSPVGVVSITVAPTLATRDAPIASISQGVEAVAQRTQDAMQELFGEESPHRIRSLNACKTPQ